VLGTLHPVRGVDAVPVVYAVCEPEGAAWGGARQIVVPIDTVKPKSPAVLQRVANLRADPRCVLLVEHYDEDWSALWWVRLHATARLVGPDDTADEGGSESPASGELAGLRQLLAARFPAYSPPGSVVAAIVLGPGAEVDHAGRPGPPAQQAALGWSAR